MPQIELDAVLKDSAGNFLKGAAVVFSYKQSTDQGFTNAGSAVTDSTGTASVMLVLQGGVYDFIASFGGTSTYLASSVEIMYDVVSGAQTRLTESINPASPIPSTPVVVAGVLSANGAGIAGERVAVALNGALVGEATTTVDGSYSLQLAPLGPGAYTLTASFAGVAGVYLPASSQVNFVVLGPKGLGLAGTAVVLASLTVAGIGLVVASRRHEGRRGRRHRR